MKRFTRQQLVAAASSVPRNAPLVETDLDIKVIDTAPSGLATLETDSA